MLVDVWSIFPWTWTLQYFYMFNILYLQIKLFYSIHSSVCNHTIQNSRITRINRHRISKTLTRIIYTLKRKDQRHDVIYLSASHLIFSFGLVKTESDFIVRSIKIGLGRWMLVVAVISADAYPFWLSQTWPVTLRMQE